MNSSQLFKNSEVLIPRKLDNPKTWIRSFLPNKCKRTKACRPNSQAKAFELARAQLELETNAIEFIK